MDALEIGDVVRLKTKEELRSQYGLDWESAYSRNHGESVYINRDMEKYLGCIFAIAEVHEVNGGSTTAYCLEKNGELVGDHGNAWYFDETIFRIVKRGGKTIKRGVWINKPNRKSRRGKVLSV